MTNPTVSAGIASQVPQPPLGEKITEVTPSTVPSPDNKRAAGVAPIDGSVGLKEINVRIVLEGAAARGDDAGSDSLA